MPKKYKKAAVLFILLIDWVGEVKKTDNGQKLEVSDLEKAILNFVTHKNQTRFLDRRSYTLSIANCTISLAGKYCFPKNFDWEKTSKKQIKKAYTAMIVKEAQFNILKNRILDYLARDRPGIGLKIKIDINYYNCPDVENWLFQRNHNVPRDVNIGRAFYSKSGKRIAYRPAIA